MAAPGQFAGIAIESDQRSGYAQLCLALDTLVRLAQRTPRFRR